MSDLCPEQKEHYEKLAMEHANFLCEKVFKPAYVMAFVHGAKHATEDKEDWHCRAVADPEAIRRMMEGAK